MKRNNFQVSYKIQLNFHLANNTTIVSIGNTNSLFAEYILYEKNLPINNDERRKIPPNAKVNTFAALNIGELPSDSEKYL